MKKITIVLGLLIFVTVSSAKSQEVKIISIRELDSIINHSKVPLVINFWATFCKPCIDEIPYFESTLQQYKQYNVKLLLISLDLQDYYPSKIKSFIQEKKIASPVLWLNETNADFFCPFIDKKWSGAIPATLLVNQEKGIRMFYDRQLTPLQVNKAIADLVK